MTTEHACKQDKITCKDAILAIHRYNRYNSNRMASYRRFSNRAEYSRHRGNYQDGSVLLA